MDMVDHQKQLAERILKLTRRYGEQHHMMLNEIVGAQVSVLGTYMAGVPEEYAGDFFKHVGLLLMTQVVNQRLHGEHPICEIYEGTIQ